MSLCLNQIKECLEVPLKPLKIGKYTGSPKKQQQHLNIRRPGDSWKTSMNYEEHDRGKYLLSVQLYPVLVFDERFDGCHNCFILY